MGKRRRERVVVSSFDDYVRSFVLLDPKVWAKKSDKPTLKEYTPQPLLMEFRKTGGLKSEKVRLPRKKTSHPLVSKEAKACANALLKTTPYRNSHKVHRDLSDTVLWAFNPYCLQYPDLPEDKGRFIFMVGSDPSKIISTRAGIAVVAGTNVALPFDRERRVFYLPFSHEDNQINVLGLSS